MSEDSVSTGKAENGQEAKSSSATSDTPVMKGKRVFFKYSRVAHRSIEFIGKHPFATGLLAILGLIGLGYSIVGFDLDRKEAVETTNQISRVECQHRFKIDPPRRFFHWFRIDPPGLIF